MRRAEATKVRTKSGQRISYLQPRRLHAQIRNRGDIQYLRQCSFRILAHVCLKKCPSNLLLFLFSQADEVKYILTASCSSSTSSWGSWQHAATRSCPFILRRIRFSARSIISIGTPFMAAQLMVVNLPLSKCAHDLTKFRNQKYSVLRKSLVTSV